MCFEVDREGTVICGSKQIGRVVSSEEAGLTLKRQWSMLSCTSLNFSRTRRRSGASSRHAPSTSRSSASSTRPSHFLGACAGAAAAADIAAAPEPRVVGRLGRMDSVSRSAAGGSGGAKGGGGTHLPREDGSSEEGRRRERGEEDLRQAPWL